MRGDCAPHTAPGARRENCRIMRATTIAGERIKRSACRDSSAEVLLKVLLPPSASNLLEESSEKGAFNAALKLLTLLCHDCMFRYSKNKIKARIGIRLKIRDSLCGSTKLNNLISLSQAIPATNQTLQAGMGGRAVHRKGR